MNIHGERMTLTSSSCRAASTDIPDPSLATSPYHSSLLAGLQGYIPYPHIAAVCMFELVILTHNFFSWPYHAVLSSRLYVFSSDETYSTGPRQRAAWPSATMVLYLSTRLCCKLALTPTNLHWLQLTEVLTWVSAISFYNAHDFRDCFRLFSQVRPV